MNTNPINKIETKQKVLGVQNKKSDNKIIKKNSETGTSNNNDGNQNIQRRIK